MTGAESRTRGDFFSGGGQMGERLHAFDWSRTPLGPIANWPQSLKTSVSLILSSRHPMWIGWGPEMTFLYNDAYLHVLGPAKHPWALGRPASQVWAEIWDVCGPLADRVFEHGEATFVDDVRLFMDRGDFLEETFYSFCYSPIRDESGKVSGLFCPSTDVSPKILNARRLRTLSELAGNALVEKTTVAACATLARTLAKNPDDVPFALLYLLDAEGRSARLEQSVGAFESNDLKPESVDLEDASAAPFWPIAEVLGSAQRRVVQLDNFDGLPPGVADQPVSEAVVLPVTSRGEDRPLGVLVAGVNPCRKLDPDHLTFFELIAAQAATAIQNAKSAEEEKRRGDMLAELDRAKTAFFSNVSHEFRTPLTLMLGPLEDTLADAEQLPPAARERLEVAHRNSLRLVRLVNTLLDFSRIEAGRVQATYEPTDLSAYTAELASVFRSAIERAGMRLIVDCPPLPQDVYIDREMWEKIVLNLLSNAFKFTFEGEIEVSIQERDGMAELAVRDTGIGIPAQELPHLFERFHRVKGARGRSFEGSGIGLALVQELVKLHGGVVSVDSAIDRGARFTVSVPLGKAHLPADRVSGARRLQSTATGAEAFVEEALRWLPQDGAQGAVRHQETVNGGQHAVPEGDGRGSAEPHARARILLADDNADMRDYVRRLLGHSYEVIAVSDGLAALQAARESTPDLVLTDIMMPRLDGFELLRALRADERLRTVPVVLVSARAGEEARVEGMQAGADDYLVKPFTSRELLARVSARLEIARIRSESEQALRRSEERFRGVFNSSRMGVAVLTLDAHFLEVNEALCAITGYSAEEMRNLDCLALIHPGDRAAMREKLNGLVAGDIPTFVIEHRYTTKNGATVWAQTSVSAMRDAHARPEYIVAVCEDVTDRKQAIAALRDSEERFRQLADAMPQMVWTARPDGSLDYFNEQWYEFSGLRRGVFGDESWEPLIHPDDVQKSHEAWYASVSTGKAYAMEFRLWDRKEQRWRWFMGRALAVRGESGQIVKWFGTATDIDEQKRTEEELRRANADLEQFAYSASHDIQEPLRTISIYSDLLSRRVSGQLDPEALDFLRFLRGSASRVQLLVQDLLAYTRINRLDAAKSECDANEQLKVVLANLAAAIAEAGADVTAGVLPLVRAHAVHVQQLFQNLIGNALKYRSPERRPVVRVSVESVDGYCRFAVADNGIGIDPQYHDRIFGLFKRLHGNDRYSGTGIGLAICKRIVERYHGRIWVESAAGQGSTFYFTLPAL